MLALWLLAAGAIPLQLEEVADVAPEVEKALVERLSELITERVGEPVSVVDCRTSSCLERDAAHSREYLHLLIFGGPKRISLSLERMGRGVAFTASQFLLNDVADPSPALRQLVREVFPNAATSNLSVVPELLPVQRAGVEEVSEGASPLTIGSAIIAGLGLGGALTLGLLAHSTQSELSSKLLWDADVPGLEASRDREVALSLGLLGMGVGAGIVALVSEVMR